jgi:twitching motility protein PilT
MVTIDKLMDLAVERDASDIHLIAGERPVLRIYGRLYRLQEFDVLTPADTERLVRSICPDRNWEELQTDRSTDFGISHQHKARFRVAAYWQKNTLAMNLRLIPYKMLSFEDLGLGREVIDLLYEPRGIDTHYRTNRFG